MPRPGSVGKTNVVCDYCHIIGPIIVWCSVAVRPGKVEKMFTCCLPNYYDTNPRYMISALLFSPPKSPDIRHGDRTQLSRSLIGQFQVN